MKRVFGAVTMSALVATSGAGPVRVALFADPGSTDAKSREAIYKLLKARSDMLVEKVSTATVRSASFGDSYDVFVLPGGTGGGEAKAIGEEAGKAIAAQVKQGKGLVAICAGGYYVAEGWNPDTQALDIINADNHDGEHWARGEQMIAVETVGGASDGETSRTMWYENGPIFKPAGMDGLPGYTPLVRYVTDLAAKGAPKGQMAGRDAVIAAPYGEGRVVAFGPHPELSPQVNHWLWNAIMWSAGRREDAGNTITLQAVLEPAPKEKAAR